MPADKPTFDDYIRAGAVPLGAVRVDSAAPAAGAPLLPPAHTTGGGDDAPEEYLYNGVAATELKKLQRGEPEREVDLHGLTLAEAHDALESFLRRALAQQCRMIEVVHGRGQHSKDGVAVLRGAVRHWLRQCDIVLAYCPPIRNDGATRALLRQRRRK